MPARTFAARFVAAIALAWAVAAGAADPRLYSGEALVTSQDEAERTRALAPALLQALVKASGDAAVATDPRATPVLEQANALLQRFSYRQTVDTVAGQPIARTWLVAQFDPAGIERALAGMGRSTWAERPPTLVWLVIDDGAAKRVATAAQVEALGALTREAEQRGVVLKFPQMDPQDFATADPERLWDGAPAKALEGAARYGAPAALVARLDRSGGGWRGRFTLVDGGGSTDWSASYADANSVLAAGANGLADRLAQRYAIPAADRQPGDYQLWIADVRSPIDYGTVLEYLGNLSIVGSVVPVGADGDRMLVQVHLEVTLGRLRQLLALQEVLQFDDTVETVGAQATLRLRH
ncbi:MAG TPA: DUF2066 domain-containing protein [Xanthomonadales bacterium]|nr:DUF2066 domain-containing protein [Xanthomonadales bacterium]